MNILVIGATGMAGHVITTYLKEKQHKVSTLAHSHPYDEETVLMDITHTTELKNYLRTHEFDAVINCVGMLIQAAENHKDKAILVNAYLPHFLEDFYDHTPTRIIHLSTDCVFSGKNGPYNESSFCDGTLFYDRTKILGELNSDKNLTFRMSIIGPDLSPNGIGLLNWFLLQKEDIRGYTKVFWNGITTLELARAIDLALSQRLTGLYHLVPAEPISKYDLLCLFQKVFEKEDIKISPCDVPCSNKVLINTRNDFLYTVPNYLTMLIELSAWMKQHKSLYPHYFT